MNDDNYTIKSGHLSVGDGHKIYFQQWGNPKATPTFFLHGGPGSNCKDQHKLNFDPNRHNIIFHDQRGAGLSTPFGTIKNNQTKFLIEDIEKLRVFFGFMKIQITGSSWGSFLALAYAVTYPKRVIKILVSGIFTASKPEAERILQGGLKTHYPDVWEQYIDLVPDNKRGDTVKYYLHMMQKGTAKEQTEHVRRWVLLESSAMTIDSDYKKDLLQSDDYDETVRTLAILGANYFVNDFYIEDNFLLNNANKLKDIPIVMVHGRFDAVCPPEYAYRLARTIGENCHLQLVPSSHKSEGALRETFRAYSWSFLA